MAPKNRTLKDALPAAGFQYRGYFGDKTAKGADITPSNGDDLLVEIFHRACERINLLPRVGHYRFWPTIFHTVPWFKAERELGPNKFRLLVTYLMQARLRAQANPAISGMSQPISRTAAAIDAYIGLLRTMNLANDIPDPDNENWDRTTYHFRPDMKLSHAEQSKLNDDVKKAMQPVASHPATSQTVARPSFAPQAAPSSLFRPTSALDVNKFKKAFESKPSFRKRKADDDEEETTTRPSEMDTLAAGLSGLAVGRTIRPIKRQAASGDDGEIKPVTTKFVSEDVMGLIESMEKAKVDEGGEAEAETEQQEEQEAEDPLAGEDIYGLDD